MSDVGFRTTAASTASHIARFVHRDPARRDRPPGVEHRARVRIRLGSDRRYGSRQPGRALEPPPSDWRRRADRSRTRPGGRRRKQVGGVGEGGRPVGAAEHPGQFGPAVLAGHLAHRGCSDDSVGCRRRPRYCRSANAATWARCVTTITWCERGQPGQSAADLGGGPAADTGVHLVEHQGGHRIRAGQHHLERQHHPRQLAARGAARDRQCRAHPDARPAGSRPGRCRPRPATHHGAVDLDAVRGAGPIADPCVRRRRRARPAHGQVGSSAVAAPPSRVAAADLRARQGQAVAATGRRVPQRRRRAARPAPPPTCPGRPVRRGHPPPRPAPRRRPRRTAGQPAQDRLPGQERRSSRAGSASSASR